jgi:hypothetical protein
MDPLCRAYLWLISVYHVMTGIISFGFPEFAMSFYRKLYGCNPVERRHLALVLKPWGALAVFAGVCGLFAATDPRRYIGVVAGLALLLLLRLIYRAVFYRQLAEISGISSRRNLVNIAFISAGLAILAGWLVVSRTGLK